MQPFDAQSFNAICNLIFNLFCAIALWSLHRKIIHEQKLGDKSDKALLWLALAVGSSSIGAILRLLGWEVTLLQILVSILNSIFLLFALADFQYAPEWLKRKEPKWAIVIVGVLAAVTSGAFTISKEGDFKANRQTIAQRETALKTADSMLSNPRTDSFHLITINRYDKADSLQVRLHSTDVQDAEEKIKALSRETSWPNFFYSLCVVGMFIFILIGSFERRKHYVFIGLSVAYALVVAISQYLAWTKNDLRFLTFNVVNSLTVVFFLLALVTWALERLDRLNIGAEETPENAEQMLSPLNSHLEPSGAAVVSKREEEDGMVGRSTAPKQSEPIISEKWKEKVTKLNESQKEILTRLCKGETRSAIGYGDTDKERERNIGRELAKISHSLHLKNDVENLLLFAVQSGITAIDEVVIKED